MIAVVQTFGDDLGSHPHIHALVTRGGWTAAGAWVPVPFVSGEAAAAVLRHRVFGFLKAQGLLHPDRIRLLRSWRHSGFSVRTSVTVPPDDRDGLERPARYLLRPPVSLERLVVNEDARAIAYAPRTHAGPRLGPPVAPPIEPEDLLARIVMHIPEPHRHVIRYYGAYSSVVRARRRRQHASPSASHSEHPPMTPASEPTPDPERRDLRRRWAELIKRIYGLDPLECPRCGSAMRIIAFIPEPRVIRKILRHLEAKGAEPLSPPSDSSADARSAPAVLHPAPAARPSPARHPRQAGLGRTSAVVDPRPATGKRVSAPD